MDHDAANNAIGNLAYLCLPHHDLYDSTTRQSKNLTKNEVLAFRKELETALGEAFSGETRFGKASTKANRTPEIVEGHYIRADDGDGSYQSAEIKISWIASKHSQYHVSGLALWGKRRPLGPSVGEFDYILELRESVFYYVEKPASDQGHSIEIQMQGRKLIVKEENWLGAYGMNVNFIGSYEKANSLQRF